MNDDMLRLPPHSIEAEQSVLGGLMLQNDALDRIADLIRAEDFYRADHRAIFAEITRQIGAGKAADCMTVAEALDRAGRLAEFGGWPYLHGLTYNTPSAANIRRYAEAVRDRARLRALATVAADISEAAYNPDGRSAAEIAASAETALAGFAEDRDQGEPETAAQAVIEVMRRLDDGAGHVGLMTGIQYLDSLTGGLEPGQLIVIGARPKVGKTAVALGIARHVAGIEHRVAFFSLEMSRRELAARLLSAEAGVDGRALKVGPTEADWSALTQAATAPWLDRLILDDSAAVSLGYTRARARRLQRAVGLGLIVIDYIQLMTPADPRTNRNEQISGLSRGLKQLAKELHVPVIVLSQLNRASEARADRRPQLSDLRDSGAIEQDADAVLLLNKPSDGVLECDLAAHRSGPTGTFWLDFDAARMTFTHRYGPPPEPVKPKQTRGFSE